MLKLRICDERVVRVVNSKSVKSGEGGYSCDTKHGNIGSDHEWAFLGS